MALVTVTNLTGNRVELTELYESLGPFGTTTFVRYLPELEAMPALLGLWTNGVVSLVADIDPWEQQWRTNQPVNLDAYALLNATRTIHEAIMTPDRAVSNPGGGPTPSSVNALMYLIFVKNTNSAFRIVKIPSNYVGDATFHIHWTKSGNSNESGKNARWRISYVIINGDGDDGGVTPTAVEIEDTYLDSSTSATSRVVYRTANVAATGFVADKYVSFKVESVTPLGTAMASDPALVSADILYTATINLGDSSSNEP